MPSSTDQTLQVSPIPAFNDNYIWMIDNRKEAVIVDPGEAGPVLAALQKRSLKLCAIVLTHRHEDHIGGVSRLLRNIPFPFTARVSTRSNPSRNRCRKAISSRFSNWTICSCPCWTYLAIPKVTLPIMPKKRNGSFAETCCSVPVAAACSKVRRNRCGHRFPNWQRCRTTLKYLPGMNTPCPI